MTTTNLPSPKSISTPPKLMGAGEVTQFLTDLAVGKQVAAGTQNQSFKLIDILYKKCQISFMVKQATTGQIIKQLKSYGPFTLSTAQQYGLSQPTISRLLGQKLITKLEPGIYCVTNSNLDPTTMDFIVATLRLNPTSVVGGLTALFHYRLVEEVPVQIWMLVAPKKRTTDPRYRLVRTKRDLSIEVLHKDRFNIVTLERALIDGLIFSVKIGEKIAVGAIIKALRNKLTTERKLFLAAQKLNALGFLEKYWQLIIAGL